MSGLPLARPFLLFLLLVVAACAARTDIGQILADPRAYEGKNVTIDGEVGNSFSLVVIKYFELNDGTGTLGVVSDKPLPAKGQRLKVTGQIREAFSLGDRNITVLVEKTAGKS